MDLTSYKLKPWYKTYEKKYHLVKSKNLGFFRLRTPVHSFIFVHLRNLPDGIIYFPYAFYDYLSNIFLKRKTQAFVFAGHCVELQITHPALHKAINLVVKLAFKLKGNTIYFQAVNTEQIAYVRKLGLPKRNIFLIPVSIFYKDMPLLDNASKKLTVLHIGGTGKNSILLTKVFDRLISNKEFGKYEFYFIGSRQPSELVSYSEKYANVKILGYVDDVEKIKYLRKSDVVVVPANETFSTAALEALECGPIVVSRPDNPAIKDMKRLGAHLFITDGYDPASYISDFRKVIVLKKDMKRLRKMRMENQRICKEYYSSGVVFSKYKKMFDAIEQGRDLTNFKSLHPI